MAIISSAELRANTGMTDDELGDILALEQSEFHQLIYKDLNLTPVARLSLRELYTLRGEYLKRAPSVYVTHRAMPCVYLIKSAIGLYKIGYTANIKQRMAQIASRVPVAIKLVHCIKTNKAKMLEKELHRHFASKNFCAEWFVLDDNDVTYIQSL